MDMAWSLLLLSSFVILAITGAIACDAFPGEAPGVKRHGL
jgi:hypothetical protein